MTSNCLMNLKKIWKDPVISGVLSSLIFGLLQVVWSAVLIFIGSVNSDFKWNGILSLLTIDIPLWIILIGIIGSLIITYLFKRYSKPSFLKMAKIENVNGFDWEWNWFYDEESKRYEICDLHPLCKQCGEPLRIRSVLDGFYSCQNRHCESILEVNTNLAIKIIQENVMKQFSSESQKYLKRNPNDF